MVPARHPPPPHGEPLVQLRVRAGDDQRSLDKLVIKAEQRYTEVGSATGQALRHPVRTRRSTRSRACCGSVDIFETQVKPQLGEGKIAYVWVDALRFEMARELCRLLEGRLRPDAPARHRHDADDHRDRHGGAAAARPISRPRSSRSAAASSAWRSTARSSRTARTGSPSSRPMPGCRSSTPSSTTCCPSRRRRSGTASRTPNWCWSPRRRSTNSARATTSPRPGCQMDGVLNDLRRGVRVLARPRRQDDRPRRRPRAPVRRRDRRGHEDRGPRRRDGGPAPPGLGGRGRQRRSRRTCGRRWRRWAWTATSTSPPPGRFACFKSQGRGEGLLPRRVVAPRVDHPGRRR